jgi:hypothetical protein
MRTIQSFNRLISNGKNRKLGPKGRSFWEFWRVGCCAGDIFNLPPLRIKNGTSLQRRFLGRFLTSINWRREREIRLSRALFL